MFHVIETRLDAADPLLYAPKAATSEREAGLDHREAGINAHMATSGGHRMGANAEEGSATSTAPARCNVHPTVKPIALAERLARLVLPPAAYAPRRILIPFAGVCSEVIGAALAGWDEVVGVEMSPEYVNIGLDRVRYHLGKRQLSLFGDEE